MLPRIEVSLCMALLPHINVFVKGKVKACRVLNLGGRAALHLKGLLFHKISVGDESGPEIWETQLIKCPYGSDYTGIDVAFGTGPRSVVVTPDLHSFPGSSSANDSETKVICGMVA